MEKIQARDEAALETLMRRYQAMLRSVIGRMIANDQDVSDVLEEVFLGVWNQASNFDTQKGKAVGWIITMARPPSRARRPRPEPSNFFSPRRARAGPCPARN